MNEPSSSAIVILSRNVAAWELLKHAAASRFTNSCDSVVICGYECELAEACRRARAQNEAVALGAVASDESAGLAAVEAGADESILECELNPTTVFAFVDRTVLRGRIRREQERLRTAYVHSERLIALGTVVASVAHEVNNPLTSLLLSAEGLKLRLGPLCRAYSAVEELATRQRHATQHELTEIVGIGRSAAHLTEARELLQELETSTQTIARVVRDLKLFTRPDTESASQLIDVRSLLDQVLRIVGRQIKNHGVIELDCAPDLPPVVAPSSRLAQVFTNILLNAAYAIGEIQRPLHRIRISMRSDEKVVTVSISDTGPGIAPNVIDRVFEPFFTTKSPEIGTGLGLSITRSILRRLGGDLRVESVHGDGTTFTALIPRPDRRELYEAQRHSSGVRQIRCPATVRRRLLIVDSDEHVLAAMARALDEQYDVLLACDAHEAIELLASGSLVDVIIADVSRPELAGVALRDWLLSERNAPTVRLMFMTAEDESNWLSGIVGATPLLSKPLSRRTLLSALLQLTDFDEAAVS